MKLKKLRTASKLSRYALAQRAGVSRVYVATLETGRADPTVGMLTKLAKALKVSVAELVK
jgi:transcriptional regulator with XRE-family HTH domain